jgi:predicted Zn-dependent protease
MINTKEDISSGKDKVLELAIDIIKAGGHYRKEEQGSLNDLRISLVYNFLETSEKNGVKEAVTEFEKLLKTNPNGVYFSIQELMQNKGILFSKNKLNVAVAILELGVKSFPDEVTTMFYLARAYESQQQPDKVKNLYSKIIKYKAYFPWERSALSKAEDFLNTNK